MTNKVEPPFLHILTAFIIHMVLLAKLCFYSITKTYIYRMREGISCTDDKEAIQLEGSLLHNHKLLLSGIKCLAVNQKSKERFSNLLMLALYHHMVRGIVYVQLCV